MLLPFYKYHLLILNNIFYTYCAIDHNHHHRVFYHKNIFCTYASSSRRRLYPLFNFYVNDFTLMLGDNTLPVVYLIQFALYCQPDFIGHLDFLISSIFLFTLQIIHSSGLGLVCHPHSLMGCHHCKNSRQRRELLISPPSVAGNG